MALIRFGEGQQRAGSIGATVYSHNRFGAYIRARSIPVNPSSDAQVAARNRVQQLSIAWNQSLTQAQRNGWDAYASAVPWVNKFGDQVYLTGLNMFIRTNTIALQAGLSRIDDAPTTMNLADAEQSLAVTGSEASQQFSIAYDDTAAWVSEDGAAEVFYEGLSQNASRTFFGGPWRYLTAILGSSGVPPTSPEAAVDAVFPIAEDQRIWVRSRILRADGRLSGFAQDNFLCAA